MLANNQQDQNMYDAEKVMLREQFMELRAECTTDPVSRELNDDLCQVLDSYRHLFHCSRSTAYKELLQG